MRVEVLRAERRRRWSFEEKLGIVEETMHPDVTVSAIARRHDLAPSVLFLWRRLAREGRLGGPVSHSGPDCLPLLRREIAQARGSHDGEPGADSGEMVRARDRAREVHLCRL